MNANRMYFLKSKYIDSYSLPRLDKNLFPIASKQSVTNFSHAYFETARDLRSIKMFDLCSTLAENSLA